jgi:hypothetical protein
MNTVSVCLAYAHRIAAPAAGATPSYSRSKQFRNLEFAVDNSTPGLSSRRSEIIPVASESMLKSRFRSFGSSYYRVRCKACFD